MDEASGFHINRCNVPAIAYIAKLYFVRHGVHWPYGSRLYRNMALIYVLIQVFVTFFGESFKNNAENEDI